jgi:hypothetical protein
MSRLRTLLLDEIFVALHWIIKEGADFSQVGSLGATAGTVSS